MDGAKGEDYFAWDFKVEFNGDIDPHVIEILEDAGVTMVNRYGVFYAERKE